MSDLETIKRIDVQHASLDPEGELVDNFWIVDTLLDIIKQLEDEVDTLEYILKDCNCRQRGKT
jgi:hypothetical protein